jgi:hypothetical protein
MQRWTVRVRPNACLGDFSTTGICVWSLHVAESTYSTVNGVRPWCDINTSWCDEQHLLVVYLIAGITLFEYSTRVTFIAVYLSSYIIFSYCWDGSSAAGQCSDVTTGLGVDGTLLRCNTPTTSVLFDGNIPTLTGLDGDMWASQLLTLNAIVPKLSQILHQYLTMREWRGLSILTLSSLSESPSLLGTLNVLITSCDSLVRVCIPQVTRQPVIFLRFNPPPGSTWAFFAEVEFYNRGFTCQPDTIITTPTTITTIAVSVSKIPYS